MISTTATTRGVKDSHDVDGIVANAMDHHIGQPRNY
jgi:hypothetical protein